MKIVGLDPGYATVGYGAVDHINTSFKLIDYGVITTAAKQPFERRLMKIADELTEILTRVKPEAVAIEKLYFTSNHKTVIDVAQARGVITLAVTKADVPIFEYTPLQVKQSVVGYGRAEKHQVMEMTRIILSLKEIPKPDDAADALAVAICHAHSAGSRLGNMRYYYERTNPEGV
ncbi:MAG: crossover junction endodeoxyribonuclease RuvC [Oscillospiraceae bacterium]|nr:crossover junction endodeoxyribonuclease RuvC [Oscillospiraceae bacterium]